jgi:uncharacterized OB-fold protein
MTLPTPEVTPLNEAYWAGLAAGELRFQHCPHCGHRWLPARRECPACLREGAGWEKAAGTGQVISWVVYHTAYHDAFRDRLPYNVAIVELDEGPRLITNILAPHDSIAAGMRVRLEVQSDFGVDLPRFAPAGAT